MKINKKDYFKVYRITDVDEKIIKALMDNAEGHTLFDHFICVEDLKDVISGKLGELTGDNGLFEISKLCGFMLDNKLGNVCIKGFHY